MCVFQLFSIFHGPEDDYLTSPQIEAFRTRDTDGRHFSFVESNDSAAGKNIKKSRVTRSKNSSNQRSN